MSDGRDRPSAIARVAETFGVPLPPEMVAALDSFVALFLRWNRSINLASLRGPDELVTRHLADSLALASLMRGDLGSAIDVGSGGGLPAIPLAVLLPRTPVDLYEPNRKKAAFLRTAVRELGLGGRVRVHAEAVETPPGPSLGGRYDLALSRATLPPPVWLALGRQLVRPGGRVAVFAAAQSDAGLPPPDRVLPYGEGRRLLLFGSG